MRLKHISLLGLGIAMICFVLFGILSKYEDREVLRQLDFSVTVKLQEKIDTSSHLRLATFVGNLMEGATFFASPEFTVVATLIMTGLAVYDRKKKQWRWWALLIPLSLTLLVAVEVYGKSIVHHPAPPFAMIKHPTTIFPADYINEQFSYPSGHSARAVFLSIIILFMTADGISNGKKRRLFVGLALVMYTALVAVSRIYLGHHWFSDVLGGLLLGSACAFLSVTKIFSPRE